MLQPLKAALVATSTLLDLVYELTGRRLKALHTGAALLYTVGRPDPTSRPERPQPVAPPSPTADDANTAPDAPPAPAADVTQARPEPLLPIQPPSPAPQDPAAATTDAPSTPDAPEATDDAPHHVAAPEAPAAEAVAPDAVAPEDTLNAPQDDAPQPDAQDAAPLSEDDAPQADPVPAALPIDGYDALTVRQVRDALDGLDREALAAVLDYERAHKNRKTLVRPIERLIDPDA